MLSFKMQKPLESVMWSAASSLDITKPLRVYGRLNKQGPPPILPTIFRGGTRNEVCFPAQWSIGRQKGETPTMPTKCCEMMYNDKYKIIFVKVTKTAGTTLIRYFTECNVEGADDRCLKHLDFKNHTDVQHILDSWTEYFVFGFSRNVLARAISQYGYMMQFLGQPGCPQVSWDTFCRDLYVIGDYCTFIKDPQGHSCCQKDNIFFYLHAIPQSNCFFTSEQQPAVDWVGRTELFETDLKELVGLLNAREDTPQLQYVEIPPKANYNPLCESTTRLPGQMLLENTEVTYYCNKTEFFSGKHAHCYNRVIKFFADDISLLKQ